MANAHTSHAAIAVSHVSKAYGEVQALDGVDLTIAPGEVVALLGPNGAGKSTTIEMLLGLTHPDSGAVSVVGLAPARAAADGIVGGMLQTGTLIPYLRVRELVTMVGSLYPNPLPVDEVLALSGCADFADRPTNKLSGGQAQRVRFAMALACNPDLLLADEPTAALDVEGRRAFWTAMRAVAAKGTTMLFATHHLDEADAYADRIVLLAQGRIAADGSTTAIKARAAGRTISVTLPAADLDELAALPGVAGVQRRGDAVALSCGDPEAALRALVARFPSLPDIEVCGADLEEAFLTLTAAGGAPAPDRELEVS